MPRCARCCVAFPRDAMSRSALIGEAAPLLHEALAGCPFPVQRADTLPEAVRAATQLCRAGDAVVVPSFCSSFDMFTDYAHRAQVFRAVQARR